MLSINGTLLKRLQQSYWAYTHFTRVLIMLRGFETNLAAQRTVGIIETRQMSLTLFVSSATALLSRSRRFQEAHFLALLTPHVIGKLRCDSSLPVMQDKLKRIEGLRKLASGCYAMEPSCLPIRHGQWCMNSSSVMKGVMVDAQLRKRRIIQTFSCETMLLPREVMRKINRA